MDFLLNESVTVAIYMLCDNWLSETLRTITTWSSSVHRIFQAVILGWITISSFRGSSWPRDWTLVPCTSHRRWICGAVLYHWATWIPAIVKSHNKSASEALHQWNKDTRLSDSFRVSNGFVYAEYLVQGLVHSRRLINESTVLCTLWQMYEYKMTFDWNARTWVTK